MMVLGAKTTGIPNGGMPSSQALGVRARRFLQPVRCSDRVQGHAVIVCSQVGEA